MLNVSFWWKYKTQTTSSQRSGISAVDTLSQSIMQADWGHVIWRLVHSFPVPVLGSVVLNKIWLLNTLLCYNYFLGN